MYLVVHACTYLFAFLFLKAKEIIKPRKFCNKKCLPGSESRSPHPFAEEPKGYTVAYETGLFMGLGGLGFFLQGYQGFRVSLGVPFTRIHRGLHRGALHGVWV